MPAPAISHLICSGALVMLIFLLPVFYSTVANDIKAGMTQKELKEISDYVSSTLANLFFLVNSSNVRDVSMQKSLIFLPSVVEDSIYVLRIEAAGTDVTKVSTFLKGNPLVVGSAWIGPGLKVGSQNTIESGGRDVLAGCNRNVTGTFAWIRYG